MVKPAAQSRNSKGPVMSKSRTKLYVGLDVHAETISIAVADGDSRARARAVGTVPNNRESLRKALRKIGVAKQLVVCYEAGPCGYATYWHLAGLGIECTVIAPTLVPVKTGDRVKTDKRDAAKLAQCHRAGELTAVYVPDAAHEALRDLVRAREAAKKDQLRAYHRLSKFLLRQGRRKKSGVRVGSTTYANWLDGQKFEEIAHQSTFLDYRNELDHQLERVKRLEESIDEALEGAPETMRELVAALQVLRGVAKITAVTVVSEVGSFRRFESAKKLMAYAGLVPSENSSGGSKRQGAITKTGNAHLRRVLGEVAFTTRYVPRRGPRLRKAQENQSQALRDISWKAQHRLYKKHTRMRLRQKSHQKTVTAMSRELLGFIWAVGVTREIELTQ